MVNIIQGREVAARGRIAKWTSGRVAHSTHLVCDRGLKQWGSWASACFDSSS
jgi:hypothetical protein